MRKITLIILASAMVLVSNTATAGRIVVAHDEWTLSNFGFSQSPGAAVFAQNFASFFTDGGIGAFHAASNNFGLTQSNLGQTLTLAGHAYSTGAGPADLAGLLAFDGIFVAGPLTGGLTTAMLVNYVNAGGNVYLAGGTGAFGGGAAEAAFWGAFLNPFGLTFRDQFNGLTANFSVQPSPHAIFDNVPTLYENNGNTVLELAAIGPNAQTFFGGRYAVFDDTDVITVPEPGSLALFGLGLFALALGRRRKTV